MKKFRKIMAVLVAAMMIMAMAVPAWATESGRIEDTTGTGTNEKHEGAIDINNIKADETYTLWRMFELASFMDTNTAAGEHIDANATPAKDEAYSYVISSSSPWYTWLTSTQTNGDKYAVQIAAGGDDTAALAQGQLFWIENATITVNGKNDYHVIYATSNFKNSADLPTASETNDAATTDYFDGDAAVIQKFAQAAVAYGETKITDWATNYPDYVPILNSVPTPTEVTNGKIALDDLLLGYYLLGSSQGTLCSLDTTNKTVQLYEKNQPASPTVEKHVLSKEATASLDISTPANIATDNGWVKNRDAKIADTVYFRTKIYAKQGAEHYILHDVMEPGLDFDKSTKGNIIYVTLTHLTNTYAIPATIDIGTAQAPDSKTNWSVAIPTDTTGASEADCDFEVRFADERLYDNSKTEHIIYDNDIITVYYSAQVNTSAVIFGTDEAKSDVSSVKTYGTDGTDGTKINELSDGQKVDQIRTVSDGDGRNTNSTILTFGKNSVTSAWSQATVTLYQFDVVKTRSATSVPHDLLAGATFNLYRATTTAPTAQAGDPAPDSYAFGSNGTYYKDGNAISFVYSSSNDHNYKYNGFDAGTSDGATVTLESKDDYELNIDGLDAGTYLLFEDTAPYGFNILAHPILITINGEDAAGTQEANKKEGKITVVSKDNNNKITGPENYNWNAWLTANGTKKAYDSTATSGSPAVNNGGIEIINKAGQELPSTGGMGTTVLYIVGGMLVILAGAYLFFSRKRTA